MIKRSKAIPMTIFLCVAAVVSCYLAGGVQADCFGNVPVFVGGEQKPAADSSVKAHTPPAGSAERKEVMDGLRADQKVVFKVHYLKVHGDWAFVDVTPLDDKGKAVAEGGASLLHKENGSWKIMDLSVLPEDPDNPMGPDDPNPKFIKAVQKAFPGVPADVFPPRARAK